MLLDGPIPHSRKQYMDLVEFSIFQWIRSIFILLVSLDAELLCVKLLLCPRMIQTNFTDDVSAKSVGKMKNCEILALCISLNSRQMCTYFCKTK